MSVDSLFNLQQKKQQTNKQTTKKISGTARTREDKRQMSRVVERKDFLSLTFENDWSTALQDNNAKGFEDLWE